MGIGGDAVVEVGGHFLKCHRSLLIASFLVTTTALPLHWYYDTHTGSYENLLSSFKTLITQRNCKGANWFFSSKFEGSVSHLVMQWSFHDCFDS